ncbi:hypothetical protein BOX15_Mlig033516g1, partial [Macrostomum lignano]
GMYSRAYACRQHGSSIDWSSLLKSSVASTSSSFQLSDVIRDEDSNKDSNANVNKLVAVGSALLASLESRPPSQWLTCRLSAWVKLGRMDRALQLLAGGPVDLLDAGFRHLLYLADVHGLYNCALGTYDLELALLVAQRTRRDPKDYVSLLQQLDGMGELERRGVIDLQLARYPLAVANFTACGLEHRFETALRLAKERRLFATACLRLDRDRQPDWYQRLSTAWASELKNSGQMEWCGLVNYQAGLYTEAAEAFKAALCPEMWLAAALLAAAAGSNVLEKEAHGMAARLCESGRHADAVLLLSSLRPDPAAPVAITGPSAFSAALDGCLWQRCELLIAQAASQSEAAELRSTLIEAARQAVEREADDAANDAAQFAEQRDRLIRLRTEREARAAGGGFDYSGQQGRQQRAGAVGPDDDAFSDAGSTVSRASSASLTSASSGTRKSRRKAKRKLETAGAKPGHPLEELGLLNSLADCLARRSRRQTQARQLCAALTGLGEHAEAWRLRRAVSACLTRLTCGSASIWPNAAAAIEDDASGAGGSSATMVRTALAYGCVLPSMGRPDSLLAELESAKAAWQRLDWGGPC